MRLPEFSQRLLDLLPWDEDGIFSGHSSILTELVEDVAKRDVRRVILQ